MRLQKLPKMTLLFQNVTPVKEEDDGGWSFF